MKVPGSGCEARRAWLRKWSHIAADRARRSFDRGSRQRGKRDERAVRSNNATVSDERGPNPDTGSRIGRSEEHTSELQSLMRNSYAVHCLNKTIIQQQNHASIYPIISYNHNT